MFQGPENQTSSRDLLKPDVGERLPPRVLRAQDDPRSLEEKNGENFGEDKKARTRIPVSWFKAAVDKVQREREMKNSGDANGQISKTQIPEKPPRRSSIPKPSDRILAARKNAYTSGVTDQKEATEAIDENTVKIDKIPISREDYNRVRVSDKENINCEPLSATTNANDTFDKKETITQPNEQVEDEFDKLYEEIVDTEADVIPDEILNTNVNDSEKLEIKFEEIVHQYDEKVKVEPADKARYSKIPLLKRRSEQDIKIPKLPERRLSLKTNNSTNKMYKIKQYDPTNSDNDMIKMNYSDEGKDKVEKVEDYVHRVENNESAEINNNDHGGLFVIESPAYNEMATPDTELVKVGLSQLDITLEEYNLNQTQNKDSDDLVTSEVKTEPCFEESIESNDTPIGINKNIMFEEEYADYTKEEAVSLNEDIDEPAIENPQVNEAIDNDTLNYSKDNNVVINELDTVNIATEMPAPEEAEVEYKQQYITLPNDEEFKSVRLLKTVNSSEERTESRFVSKPHKEENDFKITELKEDSPIVKGNVSNILNKLTSHENDSQVDDDNKSGERRELKVKDFPVRGNVSKILNRITTNDIEQSIKKDLAEKPKKESVLSKIAIFERPDLKPVIHEKPAFKYSKLQRTVSEEIRHSPKIVHEVLKPNERNGQTDKPFELVTVDILKPIEVLTSNAEQVLVVEDLKEQSVVFDNLDDCKGELDIDENEASKPEIKSDNETASIDQYDIALEEPLAKTNKNVEDHNTTTNNYDTSDNIFKNIDPRLENCKNREVVSLYVPVKEKINRLQSNNENEMKRAKSIAELDLVAIKGKVKNMIYRMNSFEILDDNIGNKQIEIISSKERPRKRSVSEKIALFERKLTPVNMEKVPAGRGFDVDANATDNVIDKAMEDEYNAKVKELLNAKLTYGSVANITYLELADGAKMPALALGTALLDPRLAKYIVGAAIDLGFRAIDTAYIYGNEKEVGEGIRAKIQDGTVKREDLFIMSKLWSTFHQPELVEGACRASLRALGLDYFDLFMIHNPMSLKEGGDAIPKVAGVLQLSSHEYLDAWFAMEALVPGLARRIGVSNFNASQVARVLEKGRVAPVVNQVECHPYLSQRRLSEFCAARGVRLSCYGTLGSKGTPAELRASQAAAIEDPLVLVMAAGLGVSPAQLLISYQLHSGHAVVVKGSTAAHLWDNLQALRVALQRSQIDAIRALNANKRTFTFQGMGDTHKHYPFQEPF